MGAFWRGLTSPLEEGDQKLIADAQNTIDSAKALGSRIAERDEDDDPWLS